MKQISLNVAATVACMEKTAFSKFFKRTVGITFREFVQQWRTGMAVQLMLESDRGLYDVACEVGFHNLAAFERTFKKVTSFTPSQLVADGGRGSKELDKKTNTTRINKISSSALGRNAFY